MSDERERFTGTGNTLQEALDHAISQVGKGMWRLISIDGDIGVVGSHVHVHIEKTY